MWVWLGANVLGSCNQDDSHTSFYLAVVVKQILCPLAIIKVLSDNKWFVINKSGYFCVAGEKLVYYVFIAHARFFLSDLRNNCEYIQSPFIHPFIHLVVFILCKSSSGEVGTTTGPISDAKQSRTSTVARVRFTRVAVFRFEG